MSFGTLTFWPGVQRDISPVWPWPHSRTYSRSTPLLCAKAADTSPIVANAAAVAIFIGSLPLKRVKKCSTDLRRWGAKLLAQVLYYEASAHGRCGVGGYGFPSGSRTPRRGGPDASLYQVRLRKPPQSYRIILDNLALLCAAHILVEPLKGARPCLLGRGLVIAFRRRVIEETMNRIRIDVTFVPDFVFLQLGFLRRISLGQCLVESAVVDEDRRLDFRHVFRLRCATIEWGGCR